MKNILLSIILILFVNCAVKEPKIINYKQDITPFVQKIKPLHVELKKFNSHYYMPWDTNTTLISKKAASWANRVFSKKKRFFGENTLPWSLKDISSVTNSTNFENFNSINLHAIISKSTQIRNLPTNKPFFKNFKEAGEGYPFDYLQNSRIHINTPILVSHYNAEGSWAFIQSPFSFGWIPTRDITTIDKIESKSFKMRKKVVIIKDKTPVYTKEQKFFTYANLGAIFPITKEDKQFFHSYTFIDNFSDTNRKINLMIPKSSAKKFPLVFNSKNIKIVINGLINQKYGWGGYLGNRDCSAMTKDFFAPFGIWLPRNSAAQKNIGKLISLKGKSDQDKESIISKYAIPFQTLIYLKGHIMLYIGIQKNHVMVLHNMWGLRTKEDGKTGRYVIGRAIISDLYLGKNLLNIQKNSLLISKIRAITIINR